MASYKSNVSGLGGNWKNASRTIVPAAENTTGLVVRSINTIGDQNDQSAVMYAGDLMLLSYQQDTFRATSPHFIPAGQSINFGSFYDQIVSIEYDKLPEVTA